MPKKPLATSAALSIALLLTVTGAAAAGDLSSQRDKLAVWAGHWKRHVEVKETQFTHARTIDYDIDCSFLPHGAFMVCNSLSLQPDPNHGGRISNAVTIFYYSDVDKTFKYTQFDDEGGPSEHVALVDGNVWTEPVHVPTRSGGMADARFIYNFVAPDRQVARFEISTDKGAHWTVVDEFVSTKVG